MSDKTKKQFGVWMDSHNATIVGRDKTESDVFVVTGHVRNAGPDNNSNENASHNQEIGLTQKFFKEIAGLMVNIDEIHVTGTGQVQEEFIRFLSDTPQYKNAKTIHSTNNRMSDDLLVVFFSEYFK
jgi:stalled ribosome rescue protein Dom34